MSKRTESTTRKLIPGDCRRRFGPKTGGKTRGAAAAKVSDREDDFCDNTKRYCRGEQRDLPDVRSEHVKRQVNLSSIHNLATSLA